MFDGYFIRFVPARSAPAYEHHLQRKPTILGSKLVATCLDPYDATIASTIAKICSSVRLRSDSAPDGHEAMHVPQPSHSAAETSATFVNELKVSAV